MILFQAINSAVKFWAMQKHAGIRRNWAMGRAFGFVTLLFVLVVGAWFYLRQTQTVAGAGTSNPTALVDLTGVRNDLLAMAQAERSHAAMKGGYASLDDLRSQGDLTMSRSSRGPYNYSSEINDTSFRFLATYSGPENSGMPRSLSIDQNMQISQE
jgi:predicted aspartyl protease